MILILEQIFQCLIVPHSNTIESHRKTPMSNLESDGQNDIDEAVYFNKHKYCMQSHPKILQWCTHVWHGYVITSHMILVKRASLYSDVARGGHPVMKGWLVPDCPKLLSHKWSASLVPYDDDVTVRPWSLPSVSMFRRRLLREQVLRPMSCEVRIISKSDSRVCISGNDLKKKLFNIIGQRTRSWFHQMAPIFEWLSIFIASRWNKNGMYNIGYAAMILKFCFHFWF